MPESTNSDNKNKKSNPVSGKNHYEILGVAKNCTEKEVREAFVTLSKIYHPDVNPSDPRNKEQFVKIYEAYSVLSKANRKALYDSNLLAEERFGDRRGNSSGFTVRTTAPRYTSYDPNNETWTWKDESIFGMRGDKSNFDPNQSYYGIKGVRRVSNYWIAGGAVMIMFVGMLLHYTAYKHSLAFNIRQLNQRNEKISKALSKAQRAAERNGNDIQLEILKLRLSKDDD